MKRIHKQYLSHLANQYLQLKKDFEQAQEKIISGFNLDINKIGLVSYGITTTAEPEMQIYADKLNSNDTLNQLSARMKRTKINAYMLFLSELWVYKVEVPGYNIDKMFDNLDESYAEIEALIQGIAGYEHLHSIDGKMTKEIPGREYIREYPWIIKLVDYWTKKMKLFAD